MVTNHLGVFIGLLATAVAGLGGVIAACLAASPVEWSDAAAKWGTLATAFCGLLLALLQICQSWRAYVTYLPQPWGSPNALEDSSPSDPNCSFPSSPTILMNGAEYRTCAYIVRGGEMFQTELVPHSAGD